jgi:hypothetical protein
MEKWSMRNFMVFLLLAMFLAACGTAQGIDPAQLNSSTEGSGAVLVEIVSLDHSPIRPAVQEALAVAAEFGDRVTVRTYTFGTPEGDAFAAEHDLTEHTPIAIFVNGETAFEVDGRSVTFYSFPQGEGTGMVTEGVWTMADFRAVLAQETE